jgi:hypothetical protein
MTKAMKRGFKIAVVALVLLAIVGIDVFYVVDQIQQLRN